MILPQNIRRIDAKFEGDTQGRKTDGVFFHSADVIAVLRERAAERRKTIKEYEGRDGGQAVLVHYRAEALALEIMADDLLAVVKKAKPGA